MFFCPVFWKQMFVILDIILIPKYGVEGAAVGMTVAYMFGLITIVYQYKSLAHISYSDLFFIRKADFETLRNSIVKVSHLLKIKWK